MLDTLLAVIGATIPIVSTIIAATRFLLKGPHTSFQLQHTKISISDDSHQERITLLMARIGNKKRILIGETAKSITGAVLYKAHSEETKSVITASADLPWMKSFGKLNKLSESIESEEAIQQALEKHFFEREERDIPQGRGEILAVAYGIERSNKLYLASKPPVLLPFPPTDNPSIAFTAHPFALEIAGENLPSTVSQGTIIIANSWENWSFPTKVQTVQTPSKLRNWLLRRGIGGKQRVLGGES